MWDDKRSADQFVQRYGTKLRSTNRKGYRATFDNLDLDGKPAARYVLAPSGWNGWTDLPKPAVNK